MVVFRSVIFNSIFYVNLIAIVILGMPSFVSERATWAVAFFWCRSSLSWLKTICGTRIEYRGLENIPEGGLIVAAKHQSFLETFAVAVRFRRPLYILKDELKWIPGFGWYLLRLDMVPVKRGKRSKAMREMNAAATERLNAGKQIMIYPEGTRRPVGAEPKYKIGVGYMYENNNVPVLPVALNTGLFWPRRKFLRFPGTVVIEFLPPIMPGMPLDKFMEKLESDIETACDRLLIEGAENHPDVPLTDAARNRLAALGHTKYRD